MRKINGAGGKVIQQWVGEFDNVRADIDENRAERFHKSGVGLAVGPHGEDATGMQVAGEIFQSVRLIKIRVRRMQPMARRVINVQKDRVKFSTGIFRIEIGRAHLREEIRVKKTAARIGSEFGSERHEALLMPFDDGCEEIDDNQGIDPRILQRGPRGVTEPETTDDYVQRVAIDRRETEIGQGDLDHMKQTRHEKFVAELNFINLQIIERDDAAPAEIEFAERRLAMIEFLKVEGHLPGELTTESIEDTEKRHG